MTHDELLAEINNIAEFADYDPYPKAVKALRAVVELHRPSITLVDKATGATRQKCKCQSNYPCPTIQAIEKELK